MHSLHLYLCTESPASWSNIPLPFPHAQHISNLNACLLDKCYFPYESLVFVLKKKTAQPIPSVQEETLASMFQPNFTPVVRFSFCEQNNESEKKCFKHSII